jgi:hypothetical protein
MTQNQAAKIRAKLEKMGWGFAIAGWVHDTNEVRLNNESYSEGKVTEGGDGVAFCSLRMEVHPELEAFAQKQGMFWSFENHVEMNLDPI